MQKKQRKASWQYLDLSFKVQFPPRHDAARLLLHFLAYSANDSGQSFHGYRSISAHTGKGHSAIHEGLRFLRDEYRVLVWERGSGGRYSRQTNLYTLDLDGLYALVRSQGIFNPDTGKLIRENQPLLPEEKLTDFNTSAKDLNTSAEDLNTSAEGVQPLFPEDRNPQEPLYIKPPDTEPGPVPNFVCESPHPLSTVESGEASPQIARPPQGQRTRYVPSDPSEPQRLAVAVRDAISKELCRGNDPPKWNPETWTAAVQDIYAQGYNLDDVRMVARYALEESVFRHSLMYAEGLPGLVAHFDPLYMAATAKLRRMQR